MSEPAATESRRPLLARLLPDEIPPVWCPLLTHYTREGAIDEERTIAHLEHVANWTSGVLVPGSTGDGWELTEAERLRVLGLVLDRATTLDLRILVGVLKKNLASARASLIGTVEWLKTRTGEPDTMNCLQRRRVVGFALSAPHGEHLSQEQLEGDLAELFDTGLPFALYQLPQVTGNELSPELVRRLAQRFPNLLYFKDSSGTDAVALGSPPLLDLFLMRGAEGDYARWLRQTGGPYSGLMLSSANNFGREFKKLFRALNRGRLQEAQSLSDRLSATMNAAFAAVADLPYGNPFANANKAIDHFQAFGRGAAQVPPPRLREGRKLPPEVLERTGEILRAHDLLPEKGYLD